MTNHRDQEWRRSRIVSRTSFSTFCLLCFAPTESRETGMSEIESTEQIRNIGIMAHIDAGKTTTTERILFYSGVSRRMGEVHDGASVMDWMEQEQERGISITAASTFFQWQCGGQTHHCNLIDTPGHIDFTVEVERSLRVLDGAVAIFCATSGVEPQSETVWRQADRYGIPRIAFVNKCDREGADPAAVAEEIRSRLQSNPLVLQLPMLGAEGLTGIIDLVHMRSRVWDVASLGQVYQDSDVPDEFLEEAQLARAILLESLSEVDDRTMELYLSDPNVSAAALVAGLRRATIGMLAVPVVMGAALKNYGIQNLLDAIVDYLPSPLDVGPARGRNPVSDTEDSREALRDLPTSALAFKIMNDPRVGLVTYLRVYSGVLSSGDQLLNTTKDEVEKVGRLVRMHASYREEVQELRAGDIGAAVGLGITTTGDTLCDSAAPIVLDHIPIPAPVTMVVLEPETEEDHAQLKDALERIVAEDPSLSAQIDPMTGRTILRGMGELHLEIVVVRLAREFGAKVRAGRPEVAYRETVSESAEFYYRLERATASTGQFAGLRLRAEFDADSATVSFEDHSEKSLPKGFLAAIRSGIREAAQTGVIAGFPLMNLKISLLETEFHPVDSDELSFKIATLRCFLEAIRNASPVLLEPVMEVEVVVPDEHVGDVVGDLNARRGKIAGIEARVGVQVIACLVPLSRMFGYSTDLRSRTKGRATYSMQLKQYNEVPAGIAEAVVARVTGA